MSCVRAVLAAIGLAVIWFLVPAPSSRAQAPPNKSEIREYKGLFASTIKGDLAETQRLLASGADPKITDDQGRTPLHLAFHRREREIARALAKGGVDPRATDNRGYDILGIAVVRDDPEMVALALELGADPKAVTGSYGGTVLNAAAQLGHDGVVAALIKAGAPLDTVNKAGWTALIEAIVLGEGTPRHLAAVQALLAAGANPNLADRNGNSPLTLAKKRGYTAIADAIAKVGGK